MTSRIAGQPDDRTRPREVLVEAPSALTAKRRGVLHHVALRTRGEERAEEGRARQAAPDAEIHVLHARGLSPARRLQRTSEAPVYFIRGANKDATPRANALTA